MYDQDNGQNKKSRNRGQEPQADPQTMGQPGTKKDQRQEKGRKDQ